MDEPTNHRVFRLLTIYAIVLAGVQLGALVLSILAIHISQSFAQGIIIVSVMAGLTYALHSRDNPQPAVAERCRRVLRVGLVLLICVSLAVWLALVAAAYLSPDVSFDGNAYHIPTIALWDAQGYVHWVATPYNGMMNGYPKGAELVTYVVVKALGDSNVLNLLNILFMPLGVLGLAYLTRHLGASSVATLCAGLAFALIPVNISQAITTYVDSAYAASAIAFVAVILAAERTARPARFIIPLGATMSPLLSVKSSGIALAGLACGALLAVWIVRAVSTSGASRQRALTTPLLCLLASLVIASIGGYWYVRNYVKTGTPFYPVGLSVGKHVVFRGEPIGVAIQETAVTPPEMQEWYLVKRIAVTWLQGLERWPSCLRYPESRWSGLGFLWLVGCVPAVLALLFLRKLGLEDRAGFYLLLILVGTAFIAMPLTWWARYTVWIYALGLPCFAVVLERLLAHRRLAVLGGAWGGVCLGLLTFEACYCCLFTVDIAFPGSLLAEPRRAFIRESWQYPRSYLLAGLDGTAYDRVLADGRVVAVGPAYWPADPWPMFAMTGQLSQPIGSRKLVLLGAASSAEDVLVQQVDFIVWDKRVPMPADIAAISKHSEVAGTFVVLTVGGPVSAVEAPLSAGPGSLGCDS